jgi:glycosyltransferase involved in cell wall biosynthesis
MDTTPKQLNKVLLIARKRAFWTTAHARALFPNQIMLPAYAGKFTYVLYLLPIITRLIRTKPDLLVLATTMPYARVYAIGKRLGLFKNLPCITDHQFLSSKSAKEFAVIWVYSKQEVLLQDVEVRHRFVFLPYPSKTGLVPSPEKLSEPYVFAGGNHKRDFESFLRAASAVPVSVHVVTNRVVTPRSDNVVLKGHLPLEAYVNEMARSLFVVVPLQQSSIPHGHCDLSIAASLGKAIITTRLAGVDEYVEEGRTGLLVDAGDVEGYQAAVHRMLNDEVFRRSCETRALELAPQFSYEQFAKNLTGLCLRAME